MASTPPPPSVFDQGWAWLAAYWGEILAVIIGGAILSLVAWLLNRTQLPKLTIAPKVEPSNGRFVIASLDIANKGRSVSVGTVGSLFISLPKILRDGKPADIVYGDIIARDYGWDLEGRQVETYDLHPYKASNDLLFAQVMSFHQESTGEYGLFFARPHGPPVLGGTDGGAMLFLGKDGKVTPDFHAEVKFTVRGMTSDGASISNVESYSLDFPNLGRPDLRDLKSVRLTLSKNTRSISPESSPVSSPSTSAYLSSCKRGTKG